MRASGEVQLSVSSDLSDADFVPLMQDPRQG